MKQILIGFCIGFMLILFLSSSPVQTPNNCIMVVPATPKQVMCFVGEPLEVKTNILNYTKLGYIVKEIESSQWNDMCEHCNTVIVVMEKY